MGWHWSPTAFLELSATASGGLLLSVSHPPCNSDLTDLLPGLLWLTLPFNLAISTLIFRRESSDRMSLLLESSQSLYSGSPFFFFLGVEGGVGKGWSWTLAASLENGVTRSSVRLELQCGAPPPHLALLGLPCSLKLPGLWAPRFSRTCQSIAGDTSARSSF